MWSIADIADALADGLARREAALAVEQAVYGMDALSELALHPVLADGLRAAGYGVQREQRYPADRHKPAGSHGERSDLVLTPDRRPLVVSEARATLFEPTDAVPFDEAYWMEIKVVSQFAIEGPNVQYASQLLSGVRRDVGKLSKDPGILHAGLLIILWVADEIVARHDLGIWLSRCLSMGLPVAAPSIRIVPIANRMGHGVGAIALYPVQHL